VQRAAARQRDGDQGGLALALREGEQPRAQGRAEGPGCLGREGAEGVGVAGFLGEEDRWLVKG
jgi:hypothetical protein